MAQERAQSTSERIEDIPIDISYSKLSDWLVSRRHCKLNWQGSAHQVRVLINDAIQDMPEHAGITELLSGTYINYFHCVKIIEILKETEASSRNFFGSYSSKRMKDWQNIVKLYDVDNLGLAEASQMLTRNVTYEVPGLKKVVAKCKRTQQDCIRKEQEFKSLVAEYKKKYAEACKAIGIEGNNVKRELLLLAEELPCDFSRIAKQIQQLDAALTHYTQFNAHINQVNAGEALCPLLDLMVRKGNVTTYEWRTGTEPKSVEETSLVVNNSTTEETPAEAEEIDWGEIDFGDDEAGGDTEEIDFGDDLGIEVKAEGISELCIGDTSLIETKTASADEVARGADALAVLDNPVCRFTIVDQLSELELFLEQRLADSTSPSDVIMMSLMQNAPSDCQVSDVQLQNWLSQVRRITSELASDKMQQLMSIRNSPRYVDRLTESITKIMDQSEKMAASARLMLIRQEEAFQEQSATEPKIDIIRKKTLELKKQIEKEISKKYNDRIVHIVGEINFM